MTEKSKEDAMFDQALSVLAKEPDFTMLLVKVSH